MSDPNQKDREIRKLAWIKVRKYADDPSKPWVERFHDLGRHHVEETAFLIEEVGRLRAELAQLSVVREWYTAKGIKAMVESERGRLFASYAEGRPPNWVCDQQTKDIVCLSVWLREELTRLGIDELGRKIQEGEFNRYSRSDPDLFVLAAEVMNNALANRIDRNRRPHRRWG